MGIVSSERPDTFGLPSSFANHFCNFHGWLALRYVFRIGWCAIDLSILLGVCSSGWPWSFFGIVGLLLVVLDQVVRDHSISVLVKLYWVQFCNCELLTKHCISCKTHPPPINPCGGGDSDAHCH